MTRSSSFVTEPKALLNLQSRAIDPRHVFFNSSPVMKPAFPTPDIPKTPGAYLLLIRLDKQIELEISRWRGHVLSPGWYVYSGSANGPGGLKARVGRHLRKGKRRHWHVDHLTENAAEILVHYRIGGQECELLRDFGQKCDFDYPVAGFGASDCRNCVSHLIHLHTNVRPSTLEWFAARTTLDWFATQTK